MGALMSEVTPWTPPGTPAGRTNYDGGTPIPSINGATKKGESGFHDPYQKPPDGFATWQEVGEQNKASLEAASIRGDTLRRNGFKYNRSNGTWRGPDGRSTTLFGIDPGPPGGGVDYHWDAGQENNPYAQPFSERQQYADAYSDDPRMAYDIEGEVVEDDQEGQTGVVGLFHWAANQSLWGRILKLFGR
jgi:hypothetical protein